MHRIEMGNNKADISYLHHVRSKCTTQTVYRNFLKSSSWSNLDVNTPGLGVRDLVLATKRLEPKAETSIGSIQDLRGRHG